MCRFVKVIVREDLKKSSGVKRWLAVQSHQTFALPGEDPSIGMNCILRQVPATSPLVNFVDMKHLDGYLETFWDGKHSKLLAWVKLSSSIMERVEQHEEYPWGGWLFKNNFTSDWLLVTFTFLYFYCLVYSWLIFHFHLFGRWKRNICQTFQLNAARDQGLSAETCCAKKIYIELSLFV